MYRVHECSMYRCLKLVSEVFDGLILLSMSIATFSFPSMKGGFVSFKQVIKSYMFAICHLNFDSAICRCPHLIGTSANFSTAATRLSSEIVCGFTETQEKQTNSILTPVSIDGAR
jgi:hypothetical protein